MEWKKLFKLPSNTFKCKEYGIIYWEIKNDKVLHQGRLIRGADASSFEIRVEADTAKSLTDHEQQFFGRDKNHIYHAWSKLKNVDRESFVEVGNNYWKDNNLVYFEYETSLKPLKGNDVKSFVYLEGYAKDESFAYYFGRPIKSCVNPLELKLIDSSNHLYAADNNQVYFDGVVLKDSDPSTWVLKDNYFSHDAKSAYYGSHKLPRVNIDSWVPNVDPYSTDKDSVFYMGKKLKNSIPESWILLGNNFSRDSKSLYFCNNKLEKIDVRKFLNLPEKDAKKLLVLQQEALYKRKLSEHELRCIHELNLK